MPLPWLLHRKGERTGIHHLTDITGNNGIAGQDLAQHVKHADVAGLAGGQFINQRAAHSIDLARGVVILSLSAQCRQQFSGSEICVTNDAD